MIKINIIGGMFGTDGYSSHTRSLANALYKVTDCRITTQGIPNWEKLVNDNELKMLTKPERKDDYNIIVAMPHQWKLLMGSGKNIGYCVWEGDSVPKSWIDEFLNDKIDYIFVPSQHTKDAICNTFRCHASTENYMSDYHKKIHIIPHGVDHKLFYSQQSEVIACQGEEGNVLHPNKSSVECGGTSSHTSSADKPFTFICNKGWRGTNWDRGGVQYLIKAFTEEFSKDENVQLMLKLNPAYITPQVLQQAMENMKLPNDKPPIHMNLDNIPFDKLVHFYHQGNCFVCPTRSEAFNLPGLEAMSCGLPTIQTNYGGQTDYMTDKNSLYCDYVLEEVKEDFMYEGINWATVKMSDLKELMRFAFENQKIIKEMGKQAEIDSKQWSWDASAKKIVDILKS